MADMTEFVAGTDAKASEVNNNFKHGIVNGTSSPINFTPTDATTNVLILVKVEWTSNAPVGAYDFTLTLVSDQDGTLDTAQCAGYTVGGAVTKVATIPLQYGGNLSAATHSLSIGLAGTAGSLSNIKISAWEFLG